MSIPKIIQKILNQQKKDKPNTSNPDTISSTSDNKFLYIKHFYEAGLKCTPLNGKKPILQDWTSKYIPPSKNNFPYNYGVVLDDDFLVVDVDPRNFDNENVLKDFTTLTGALKSLTIRTGGGGLHIYFKKPDNVKIRKSLQKFKGIEFKTRGNQVVGPESVHPDTGSKYEIVSGNIRSIQPAPEKLLEILSVESNETTLPGLANYTDTEQNMSRYSEFLVSTAQPAVQGQNGDLTTFRTACRGRDLGLSPDTTFDLMVSLWNSSCEPPWSTDELRQKVDNAYRYAEFPIGSKTPESQFEPLKKDAAEDSFVKISWTETKKGEICKTLGNTVNYMLVDTKIKGLMRFNLFTKDIEFMRAAPWHKHFTFGQMFSDSDAVAFKYHLGKTYNFEVPVQQIYEAVSIVAKHASYHPVRDYLNALEWDGIPRLDSWLEHYCGVQGSKYTSQVGAKTLIGAVSRVFDPGCKFDYMLVLEGDQGIGKSTVCSILGGDWYGDAFVNMHDKDTVDSMRGKWIMEISEMEVQRRAEAQAMKAFITRQIDRVRLAYARSSENFPRQCIFIGTINPEVDGYLKDPTGNRRYWPVLATKIRMNEMRKDRDQIWAEATARYKKGDTTYLEDQDVIHDAMLATEARSSVDAWVSILKGFVNQIGAKDRYTVTELFELALGGHIRAFTSREHKRIAQVMLNHLWWNRDISMPKAERNNVFVRGESSKK